MANITYNNIVDRLKSFADGHKFVRSFVAGSLAEADIEKSAEFPKMVSVYNGSNITEGIKTYNIELHVLDLPKDSNVKLIFQQEIISDAEQILEDLINDINYGFNVFKESEHYRVRDFGLLPFDEEYSNVLSGAILTLSIEVPYLYDACNLPLEGIVLPPTGDCPDGTVTDSDGVSTFTVTSGGTASCTPCPAKSGFLYINIIPSEYTSYRTGDVGWHLQNSSYKYAGKPSDPLVCVDLDVGSLVFPYQMVENNAFGNKNRFTTDTGGAASDGRGNFLVGDFAGATTWYVIDHYLGLGIYIANLGKQSWNDYIDACVALTVGAYSDFRPFSINEFISVVNKQHDYNAAENIFRQGVVSGDTEIQFQIGSSAFEFSPSTYSYMYTLDGTIKLAQKVYTNLAGYAVRTDRR